MFGKTTPHDKLIKRIPTQDRTSVLYAQALFVELCSVYLAVESSQDILGLDGGERGESAFFALDEVWPLFD